jgi:SanA protein
MLKRFHLKKWSVPRLNRRFLRRLIVIAVLIGLPIGLAALAPRLYTALHYRGDTYTLQTVPYHKVTIIFGAAIHTDGGPSDMLADRVAMGAALYHAGKTDILLLTGDNRFVNYNEPEVMRRYALQLGVPDSALVLDYAGRRTYDSCYRAHEIFQVEDAILVTQNYHLDRALLLCNQLGVEAVGVAADSLRPDGYSMVQLRAGQVREFPATALALLDLVRRPEPVLGDPLPIVRVPSEQP